MNRGPNADRASADNGILARPAFTRHDKTISSMRIVLLSAEYPPQPGGIGDYTQQLAQALGGRGHAVTVGAIHDQRFTMYDLCSGQQQQFAQPVRWNWASWQMVIAALDRLRPDVLHIQYQTGAYAMHPAINLLPWRLRGLPQRPKLVVTAHDLLEPYLFPKAGPLRTWVTRRLLCDCDMAIVTNSDDLRQASALGCAAHLIPIGSNIMPLARDYTDRATRRSALGANDATTLIAYFGLLGRTKGVDTLVAALALLPATFRLVIIGGEATAPHDRAYAAAVRQQVAALGLSQRVTITGHVSDEAVSRWLYAADLAALPFADGASFRRGSLLAALAHGLPVVTTVAAGGWGLGASDAGAISGMRASDAAERSTANPEPWAEFVPPGDPAALAVALARLAADPRLRTNLGSAALALAAHFDWDAIAAGHEALYRSELKN